MNIYRYLNNRMLNLISICAILALTIMVFSFFLKDDVAAYYSLRQKLSILKSTAEMNAPAMEGQIKRASDTASIEMEINHYKEIFSPENRTTDFLKYISNLARIHRIEVETVEPGEVIRGDEYNRNLYTTMVSGRFHNIYHYMYRMEEDWKAVKIERVVMDSHSDDGRIQAVLTVSVLSI